MIIAIVSLIILISILLVLIVLAQDSKGGGLTGGAGASQVMGVQRTTDLLEKLTWGLAGSVMVFCVLTSFVIKSAEPEETEGVRSVNIERAKSAPAALPAPAPTPAGTPAPGAAPAGTPAPGAVPTPEGTPAPAQDVAPETTPLSEPAK